MHKIKKGFNGFSTNSFIPSRYEFPSSKPFQYQVDLNTKPSSMFQLELGNLIPQQQQFSLPSIGAVPQIGQSQSSQNLITFNRPNKEIKSPELDLIPSQYQSQLSNPDFLSESSLFDQTQLQADQNHRDFLTGMALQSTDNDTLNLMGDIKMNDWKSGTESLKNDVLGNDFVKESFMDKFNNSTFGKHSAAWSKGLDTASSVFTGIFGQKAEYEGTKGDITQGLDSAYDTISDAVAMIPGWGTAASLIMKGGKMLGNVANKLGGGTDGMTTTDAIMGSSFLQITPFGLINGFGGKRANTITKDDELFETMGSSYAGTNTTVDEALIKSGKKYGLFSAGARHQANDEINEAKRQQAIMSNISDEAQDRFAIRNSMSAINGNRRMFALQGGYNQGAIRAARYGLSFKTIMKAKKITSAMKFQHLEQSSPETVNSFQQGGILEIFLKDIPEEYLEPITTTVEEITLDSIIPEFKEGGKFNVIPEGALHARLHHIENADDLTKKGIPVVSKKEGGGLEQQAEIEREEIIFRLEVTKKLEELMKKYTDNEYSQKEKDEVAIEAGKLLVDEILNNTIDNTGLLNTIE